MKKNLLGVFLILIMVFAIVLSTKENIHGNGNGRANKTGAPGETDCLQCHAPDGITTTTTTDSFLIPNNEYLLDSTYNMYIRIDNSVKTRFGFCLEVLDSATGASVGTLIAPAGSGTKLLTGVVSGITRTSIVQTASGSGGSSGSKLFAFKWKAPSTTVGVGSYKIYCWGNAANFDFSTIDDNPAGIAVVTIRKAPLIVGIKTKVVKATTVNIFPNPCTAFLQVAYNLEAAGNTSIKLYNTNGQLVNTLYSGANNVGDHIQNIPIASYAKGNYILLVNANNKISTHRISKI